MQLSRKGLRSFLQILGVSIIDYNQMEATAKKIWRRDGRTAIDTNFMAGADLKRRLQAVHELVQAFPGFFGMETRGPEESKFIRTKVAQAVVAEQNERLRMEQTEKLRTEQNDRWKMEQNERLRMERNGRLGMDQDEQLKKDLDTPDVAAKPSTTGPGEPTHRRSSSSRTEITIKREESETTMSLIDEDHGTIKPYETKRRMSRPASIEPSNKRAKSKTPTIITNEDSVVFIEVWTISNTTKTLKVDLKHIRKDVSSGPEYDMLVHECKQFPFVAWPEQIVFVRVIETGTNDLIFSSATLQTAFDAWMKNKADGNVFFLWAHDKGGRPPTVPWRRGQHF